jgi:hypothetical protein
MAAPAGISSAVRVRWRSGLALDFRAGEARMIRFNCVCGRELQSPEELAGYSGACPRCGRVRTVPHRPASYDAGAGETARPGDGVSPGHTSRRGTSFTLAELVVVLGIVGVLVGLLLPGLGHEGCSFPRAQSENNLKQLGLAMHNYAAVNGTFPPAGGGKDTHPGLSWRVSLLPYIEEDEIYGQFHLDEPWDSPHNLRLLPQMPKTFVIPGADDPPGMTRYRVFVGKSAAFEVPEPGAAPRGRRPQDFGAPQGTILVVEAADAVPWTKPDELVFDPDGPRPRLSTLTGGSRAVMVDTSIRVLGPDTSDEVLRKLILRGDR